MRQGSFSLPPPGCETRLLLTIQQIEQFIETIYPSQDPKTLKEKQERFSLSTKETLALAFMVICVLASLSILMVCYDIAPFYLLFLTLTSRNRLGLRISWEPTSVLGSKSSLALVHSMRPSQTQFRLPRQTWCMGSCSLPASPVCLLSSLDIYWRALLSYQRPVLNSFRVARY